MPLTLDRYTYAAGGRYNITHGDVAPVRRTDGETSLRWGMTPPWRGHGGKRGPLVYGARLDQLERLPMLREAYKKRRCIVLADGFYVVHGKQALWMHGESGFAGVWGERDDGIPSFALLHIRNVPAVAPAGYLSGEGAREGVWRSHEIAPGFASHDDPSCIAPLAQTSLF